MEPTHLAIFAAFIRETTGLTFEESNWYALKVSLLERMNGIKMDNPHEYLAHVKENSKEREELIALLIVSETYFFRDRRQFDVLKDHVLPEIIERKSKDNVRPRIKIASCGCSHGAEPYSIAMALEQKGFYQQADIEIIACDINKKSITFAQEAVYSEHYFREPDTDLTAYFDKRDKKYVLKEHIRSKVDFYCANLVDLSTSHFYLQDTDVIFFRNVLIYFNEQTISKVLNVFEQHINRNGYLFLGPSESLIKRDTRFSFVEIDDAFIWRLRESKAPIPQEPAPIIKPLTSHDFFAQMHDDEAHYANAAGYSRINQIDKAEQEFQAQLQLKPDHLPSLTGLAHLYAQLGKDAMAFDYCQRILKLNNLMADAYFIQGLILYKSKHFKEAQYYFKKTVYCDTRHFVGQYFLAQSYKACNQINDANRQFRVAIHAINDLGDEGLTKELAGHCGNYILSLCIDNVH